jgi:hypothetical protein
MSRTGSRLRLACLALLLPALAAAAEAPPVAAAAEEPAPAGPIDPDELPDALPADGTLAPPTRPGPATPPVPRVVLGVNVGAALPLAGLGPSVAPGLEAGVVLDPKGRYTVLLGLGYAGGVATGTGEDPAFSEGYTWVLSMRSMQVAPALRVRVLPWEETLSPELSAGPILAVGDAVASGSAGGAPFPETREARLAPGGFVAAGLAGRVGPGVLEGRLTFSVLHYDAVLTGPAFVPSLTPAIGYRVQR